MSGYEPDAGLNMPAGCFDVPDPFRVCEECRWSYMDEDGALICTFHGERVFEDWCCKYWRQG